MEEKMQRDCRFWWEAAARVVVFFFVVVVLLNLQSFHNHGIEAAAGFPVKFLPGFDGPLPFDLETGYIGVGENEKRQFFYYFIKSDSNPQEDPLILWITGGRTCSALRTIFQQIGPLLIEPVEYNGSLPRLLPFPYSWTKVASIIFLNSPVGVGFSYAPAGFSYATTLESLQSNILLASSNAYEFLQKWLIDHPEFLSNPFYVGGHSPFYVGGHSHAGVIVPTLCEMISNGMEKGVKPLIQLKGYILGSPNTFPTESNYKIPFAHGMGLISDRLYESLKENCKGDYINVDPTNSPCQQDLQTFNQLIENINDKHILEPSCLSKSTTSSSLIMLPGQKSVYDDNLYSKLKVIDPFFLSGLQCRVIDEWSNLTEYWANDHHVQMALHVRKGTKEKWQICDDSLPYTQTINNTIPYHAKLSKKGYRSLIYCGDHDMARTYISTEMWIKSLNYSVIDDWRSWMVEGQVAGYTMAYSNQMTFATVKGGGHVLPDYRPFESQVMFERWISYQNL